MNGSDFKITGSSFVWVLKYFTLFTQRVIPFPFLVLYTIRAGGKSYILLQ